LTLARFKEEPWRTSHAAYQGSAIAMSPAPEYASSEVIIASLYRHVGLAGASERTVPQKGRDLDRTVQRSRDLGTKPDGAVLDGNGMQSLLHSVLESPKLPNQSSKRFVQVTPLVPQASVFSGSARLSSNSWPAGALVRRMVWLGSADSVEAKACWRNLFEALSIEEDDDVFARFLQAEAEAWSAEPKWAFVEDVDEPLLSAKDMAGLDFPAKQLVRDLGAIIKAKPAMTRRQWVSLLEAVVRLATVAHVAWTCEIHEGIWSVMSGALSGHAPIEIDEARKRIYPANFQFLSYGDRALPAMKDRASAFLQARIGINAILWALDEQGIKIAGLSSAAEVASVCNTVSSQLSAEKRQDIRNLIADLAERENRALLCKKGIGSNIMEFARHALGQRQAANPILRGYDQGYVLKKRGTSNSSPWVVGLGPVAVLALVHCALAEAAGPRSVRRLAQHLSAYGVSVDYMDIASNDLGHQLRMLGLVLDSPDAESGMLLVPPFPLVEDQAA
jgi:hypothetical protein